MIANNLCRIVNFLYSSSSSFSSSSPTSSPSHCQSPSPSSPLSGPNIDQPRKRPLVKRHNYFDYDYESAEMGDSFIKKLDYLFGNEGIRYKRNRNESTILGPFYFERGTPEPELWRQLKRQLNTFVPFTNNGVTPRTIPLVITPTLTTPVSHTVKASLVQGSTSSNLAGPTRHMYFVLNTQPWFGRNNQYHQTGGSSNMYDMSEGMTSQATPIGQKTTFINSHPEIRLFKKNPYDKEGIRFKRSTSSPLWESNMLEFGTVRHYPFDKEGEKSVRFK